MILSDKNDLIPTQILCVCYRNRLMDSHTETLVKILQIGTIHHFSSKLKTCRRRHPIVTLLKRTWTFFSFEPCNSNQSELNLQWNMNLTIFKLRNYKWNRTHAFALPPNVSFGSNEVLTVHCAFGHLGASWLSDITKSTCYRTHLTILDRQIHCKFSNLHISMHACSNLVPTYKLEHTDYSFFNYCFN